MEIQEVFIVERNVFLSISVLLILVYAILKNNFPKVFAYNYSLAKLFSFRTKEEAGISLNIFNKGSLLLSGIYALTFSFTLVLIGKYLTPEGSTFFPFFYFDTFLIGILKWILIAVIIYLLMLIRYGFLYFFSRLFNLGTGHQRQFLEGFNISSTFFLLIAFILSTLVFSQLFSSHSLAEITIKTITVFFFYRTIIVYFKLLQISGYSKLYIFSYICTTELIPLFIGLKYLVR